LTGNILRGWSGLWPFGSSRASHLFLAGEIFPLLTELQLEHWLIKHYSRPLGHPVGVERLSVPRVVMVSRRAETRASSRAEAFVAGQRAPEVIRLTR
jgi:hypothetical protein